MSHSIIRVYDRNNPSVYENSKCTNVKQRLQTIRDNILAVKGQHPGPQLARWQKFQHVAAADIVVEIFRSKKTVKLENYHC